MSHQNKHSNLNYSDSSDSSELGPGFTQGGHAVIRPPRDYKDRWDSSHSDSSCPDFSDLCRDLPKACGKVKKLCRKPHQGPLAVDESAPEGFEAEARFEQNKDHKKKSGKCGRKGCGDKCGGYCGGKCGGKGCGGGKCGGNCGGCNLRQCKDHSATSVLRSLEGSSDPSCSSCPSFGKLACDKKKQCCPLKPLCGHPGPKGPKGPKILADAEPKGEPLIPAPILAEPVPEPKLEIQVGNHADRSNPSKGKKFNIKWGSSETHQWAEYNKDSQSIHINGKNGPVLHLYRGCNYFFCVDQGLTAAAEASHAFILTNSPAGGSKARPIPGSPAPTVDGCVSMLVDAATPRYFYYQDAKNKYQGGLIIVHDK